MLFNDVQVEATCLPATDGAIEGRCAAVPGATVAVIGREETQEKLLFHQGPTLVVTTKHRDDDERLFSSGNGLTRSFMAIYELL
jgi:hypothetical protein